MANILQVTTPNVNDNRNIINPQDPKHSIGNQAIRNPVDPTRVVRGDGRDGQGNTTQDALFSVVDYESNYGAFIKGLGEEGELAGILERYQRCWSGRSGRFSRKVSHVHAHGFSRRSSYFSPRTGRTAG